MRRNAVYPMRRQSRACDGALSGFNASWIAAASRTDNSAITHDDHGSGERNSSSTG